MIRDGWGSPNPVFRHFFTTTFMPDAQPEVAASFDELQRIATSPAAAMRIWKMNSEVDMTELARKISVPTLVLHCTGDRVAPMEEGRLMAQLIPNATFDPRTTTDAHGAYRFAGMQVHIGQLEARTDDGRHSERRQLRLWFRAQNAEVAPLIIGAPRG